jgi:hypothetical protein
MGLVSGDGGRALNVCPSFVRQLGRHGAVLGATRRCVAAPWREADCPRLNSDGGPLSDGGERAQTELPGPAAPDG